VSLTRIIVLANSWKHDNWCVAGIEQTTAKWVRPVTQLDDGRVPKKAMKLGGYFPRLLDIIDIPLAADGPDFGFESENRTILPGRWYLRGKASTSDVVSYTSRPYYVLHNHKKYVTLLEMKRKVFEKRVTLQLIRVDDFKVWDKRRQQSNKPQWKGGISSGGRELEVNITDPVFFEKLNKGHKPSKSCILTMSLGMPFKPPDWADDEPPVCWKLIAAVIEI